MKRIMLTESQLEDFSARINSGTSLRKLEEETGFNRKILSREIKKYLNKETNFSNRKYELNENYFENIDSSEKAYWLGFIAADGCIYQTGSGSNVLSFNLNVKDKNHLEKFLQAIESTAIIKTIKGTGFGIGTDIASLQINSNKMVKDLNNLGVVQKKSLVLDKPNIDKKFYNDWIRGYFDGDGSVYRQKQGNTKIDIGGTGFNMITDMIKILYDNKITVNMTCKYAGVGLRKHDYYVLYTSSDKVSKQFADYIYKDCGDLYLRRKYNRLYYIPEYNKLERLVCPICNGNNTIRMGTRQMLHGLMYRGKCKDCKKQFSITAPQSSNILSGEGELLEG